MLFSIVKNQKNKSLYQLSKPLTFNNKSRFLDVKVKKCSKFKDLRVDYLPLRDKNSNLPSLIRVWYLMSILQMAKTPLTASKQAIFPYRQTNLFSRYENNFQLSLTKHFYDTLVEHHDLFYHLTISTSFTDKLHLISCLYSLKSQVSNTKTIIKQYSTFNGFHNNLVNRILKVKWKLKVVEFIS